MKDSFKKYKNKVPFFDGGYENGYYLIYDKTKLFLDTYSTGCKLAYSLRLLTFQYGGSCIRVRRNSDNAEMDIGFINGFIDIDSLKSFCGGGNGYVTTWYNQMDNTFGNMVQSTAINQPLIIENGETILTDAGLPSVKYILNTQMGLMEFDYSLTNNFFLTGSYAVYNYNGELRMLQSNNNHSLIYNLRNANGCYMDGTITHDKWGEVGINSITSLSSNNNIKTLKYNDNLIVETNNNSNSWGPIVIGCGTFFSYEVPDGTISELIIWDNDMINDQTNINNNLINFWNAK